MKKIYLYLLILFFILYWQSNQIHLPSNTSHRNSDYIYNHHKLPTFEILLPDKNLKRINQNPAAKKYVPGNLVFENKVLKSVGIRYKGSRGAFMNCLSNKDWINPSGHKVCTKLSIKIKINWVDPSTRFYGLKKLQFHSMNNDKSHMRERLGYWLFRKMGVPAPRAIHARLKINGKYIGLFTLVEQIDDIFIKHNFKDYKGNLYKEIWPLKHTGEPFTTTSYLKKLKSSKGNQKNTLLIKKFATEVRNSTDPDLKKIIKKWMNIDEIISYIVVDRAIRNDDGIFHWYCVKDNCFNHNFFWYEEPTARKLHLIPWDLDHAFENIISNKHPITSIEDSWGEISNNCQPFKSPSSILKQKSATCDKLIKGWSQYKESYNKKKIFFGKNHFSKKIIDNKLKDWTSQIQPSIEEAEHLYPDAVSLVTWQKAVNQLKNQLKAARNNILK